MWLVEIVEVRAKVARAHTDNAVFVVIQYCNTMHPTVVTMEGEVVVTSQELPSVYMLVTGTALLMLF